MPLQADDLRVGQYVAIVENVEPDAKPELQEVGGVVCAQIRTGWRRPEPVGGRPLRVAAVSLPFICLQDKHGRYTFDVRHVRFGRIHEDYVAAVYGVPIRELPKLFKPARPAKAKPTQPQPQPQLQPATGNEGPFASHESCVDNPGGNTGGNPKYEPLPRCPRCTLTMMLTQFKLEVIGVRWLWVCECFLGAGGS